MATDWGQWPRVTAVLRQFALEVVAERAGEDPGPQRGVVDVDDAGQAGQVEGHAAGDGHGPAAHARPPGGRGERHAVLGGEADGGRHPLGVGRPGHRRRPGRDQPLGGPHGGEGPPVAAGVVEDVVADGHALGAEVGGQSGEEGVGDGAAGDVEPHGPGPIGQVDGKAWCARRPHQASDTGGASIRASTASSAGSAARRCRSTSARKSST